MPFLAPVTVDWPGHDLGDQRRRRRDSDHAVVLSAQSAIVSGGRRRIAVAIVAFFVHQMATPIPGVGIAVPTFAPPLAGRRLSALVLSRRFAAPLAYIGGSIGVLIGADLLNLGRLQSLGAPVASIGGAGTFDGVFLTGRHRRAAGEPRRRLTWLTNDFSRHCKGLLNQTASNLCQICHIRPPKWPNAAGTRGHRQRQDSLYLEPYRFSRVRRRA